MSISTSRVMEYDPFRQEFQADPFPVYRWMRDEAPVFYSEKWNWWALSRFEDVRAAARVDQFALVPELRRDPLRVEVGAVGMGQRHWRK